MHLHGGTNTIDNRTVRQSVGIHSERVLLAFNLWVHIMCFRDQDKENINNTPYVSEYYGHQGIPALSRRLSVAAHPVEARDQT